MALRLRIEARPEAIDDVLILVHEDAATGAATGADALMRSQIPYPLLVQEILAAQSADRAKIDDVAG